MVEFESQLVLAARILGPKVPMRFLPVSASAFLVAACVGPSVPPPSSDPDYSYAIKSKAAEIRTKAANIALEYSKGSESAEAIATAVVTTCSSDIDELARMQVAQACRGETDRVKQMFLAKQPYERARREWRSAVYERAVADVIEFRTDAAKAQGANASTIGAPKAAVTPITYEELLKRADEHRKAVLDLPGVDKKSPEELGDLVADRCRHDIDAHMLLLVKDRPADSDLSLEDWDAKARNLLRGIISSMTAYVVAVSREGQRR